jgi:hypothetical protein
MANPQSVVQAVAKRVTRVWWSSFAGPSDGVPLGAVAALSLMGGYDDGDGHPRDLILEADDKTIADFLAKVWAMFTIMRPELAFRCGPFGEWLNDDPHDESLVMAAAAVVRAAVGAGLLDLTFDREAVQEVDLLGHLHQELRSTSAKKSSGQFYTPAEVADLMAQLTATDVKPEPGQSICDIAAGTGGLLRPVAVRIRREGGDPHNFCWYACDVDRLAVAALAVNFHLWDLGPRVVVGCANTLVEGDWHLKAIEEQRAAVEAQQARMEVAKAFAVLEAFKGRSNGSSPE